MGVISLVVGAVFMRFIATGLTIIIIGIVMITMLSLAIPWLKFQKSGPNNQTVCSLKIMWLKKADLFPNTTKTKIMCLSTW